MEVNPAKSGAPCSCPGWLLSAINLFPEPRQHASEPINPNLDFLLGSVYQDSYAGQQFTKGARTMMPFFIPPVKIEIVKISRIRWGGFSSLSLLAAKLFDQDISMQPRWIVPVGGNCPRELP